MIDYPKLHPKKGQPVLGWWKNLLAWAQTLPVIVGPNVLVTQTPLGVKVRLRSQNPVRTPFRVGVNGGFATVTRGFVDGEYPWMPLPPGGSVPAVRLDGSAPELEAPLPGGQIRLDLAEAGPGEDGRSFICLVAHLETMRAAGLTSPGLSPETLVVAHYRELTPAVRYAALQETGAVIHPLAVLYWDVAGRRVARVGQVTHYHLQIFVDPDGIGYFAAT